MLVVSALLRSASGLFSLVLESGRIIFNGLVPNATARYLLKGAGAPVYAVAPERTAARLTFARPMFVRPSQIDPTTTFEKQLQVNACERHEELMVSRCLPLQIINKYPSGYPRICITFGLVRSGRSGLICRFPAMQPNVGRYYPRMYLSEPPGGAVYETMEGIATLRS